MEAEEALRFTQLLLDRAARARSGPIQTDGFLYVNEAACSMLGTAARSCSLSVPDTLPPEQAASSRSSRRRAAPGARSPRGHPRAEGGRALPAEVTLSHLEVQGREVLLRLRPRRHRAQAGGGRPARLGGAYHVPLRGGAGGLYRHHPGGADARRNSALVRTLGFRDLEPLLETQVGDLYLDPEDRSRWQRAFEGAARCRASMPAAPPPGRRGHLGALHRAGRPRRAGGVLHYEGAPGDVPDRRTPSSPAGQRGSGPLAGPDALGPDLDPLRGRHRALREPLAPRVLGLEPEAHAGGACSTSSIRRTRVIAEALRQSSRSRARS